MYTHGGMLLTVLKTKRTDRTRQGERTGLYPPLWLLSIYLYWSSGSKAQLNLNHN